jgi:capsular exopolysaccharide synthesis family protein
MPSEGKSFVALNLASALALLDKKVVLLEFDLRKPKVSSYLGISNHHGLTNYLIGTDKTIDRLITSVSTVDNFYIIPSGPIPPNPAELMSGSNMSRLFAELREKFDYIVIDAPPVGVVADALLLKDYTDILLYVVRHNYTTKAQLNIVEDLYEGKKFDRIAIIINDISQKGGGYGYNYSYGYGYTEDAPKQGGFLRKKKV